MREKHKKTNMREEMPFLLGTPPPASSPLVSRIMQTVKTKDTTPELLIRKHLWATGIRGYRKSPKNIPGRPDICFVGRKVAIFINGCFWHRCPHCSLPLPKSNTDFWKRKFERNILRDQLKTTRLQESGWTVMTIWECEINRDTASCVERIRDVVLSKDPQR